MRIPCFCLYGVKWWVLNKLHILSTSVNLGMLCGQRQNGRHLGVGLASTNKWVLTL